MSRSDNTGVLHLKCCFPCLRLSKNIIPDPVLYGMPDTKLSSINYDTIYGGKKVCAKCHVNAYGEAISLGRRRRSKRLAKKWCLSCLKENWEFQNKCIGFTLIIFNLEGQCSSTITKLHRIVIVFNLFFYIERKNEQVTKIKNTLVLNVYVTELSEEIFCFFLEEI